MRDFEHAHLKDSVDSSFPQVYTLYCVIFDEVFEGHGHAPSSVLGVNSNTKDEFGFHPENLTIDIIDPNVVTSFIPHKHEMSWASLRGFLIKSEEKNIGNTDLVNKILLKRSLRRVRVEATSPIFWPSSKLHYVSIETSHSGLITGNPIGRIVPVSIYKNDVPKYLSAIYSRKKKPGGL